MTDGAPTPTSPLKKKRFQFKHRAVGPARSPPEADPSSAEAKKDDSEDESLNLFRRSKEFFPKAIQDRERRVKAKKERRKSGHREGVEAQQPDQKRRKVSGPADDDEDMYGVSDREEERRAKLAAERASTKPEPETPSPNRTRSTFSHSSLNTAQRSPPTSPYAKLKPESETATPTKPVGNTVNILSSDDEDDPTTPGPQPPKQRRPSDASLLGPSAVPAANTPPEDDDDDDVLEEVDPEFEKYIIEARNAKLQQGNEDRIMGVVVTSRLRNGTTGPVPPLVANTRTARPLGILRTEFIKQARMKGKLDIQPEEESSILLTWKRVKIYDVSTGLSLGVGQPNERGLFLTKEGYSLPRGTNGFQGDRVHFEAWTTDIYNHFLKHRDEEMERKLAGNDDDFSDDEMATSDAVEVQDEAQPVEKLRLTLKSRDHEPVRLSAEGDTEVAVLVAAFRKQRDIVPEQRITLQWDGETLDETTTLSEADIGDEDTLDVHIN